MNTRIDADIETLGALCMSRGIQCAVAESCTGGLLGAYLTRLPGASRWFAGGLVAYDNRVKIQILGIEPELLREYGAVSEQAARRMAQGVCQLFHVPAAISITGIAGPDGGSPEKPVGLAWIGCALHGSVHARSFQFQGSREQVRKAACAEALHCLLAQFS
ncbi:MAG: CinA family protein [Desulfovibrionaceae bacterium]|nr:CinA family protein [Desulfovibrionaceae bacterium]